MTGKKQVGRRILLGVTLLIIILAIFFLQQTKEARNPENVKITDVAKSAASAETMSEAQRISQKEEQFPRAKEVVEPDGYLNTDQINITSLIGKKVILVDFWTYSCINCQRTIPYLNDLYAKYKDKGLIIIGVHTPEFEFEHKKENVARAIQKFGIQYPIVQDNEYKTWTAYENRYWPRKYLIDIDGFIVYDHIGEGGYEETEQKVVDLLNERSQVLNVNESVELQEESQQAQNEKIFNVEDALRTPEIYFGYAYGRGQLGNEEGWREEEIVAYTLPAETKRNRFYLEGAWRNNHDNMESAGDNSSIYLKWHGKEVNFVGGADMPLEVQYKSDNEEWKTITIKDFILYTLLKEEKPKDHALQIKAPKGLAAFTFTFG